MTQTLPIEVMQLDRDRECKRCNLHLECKTVCIPTTLHGLTKEHGRAILILGEAPGGQEDKVDQPFVGPAGHMLREVYINYFKLDTRADVYLGNAVRCRPPGNRTPNKTQLRACHGFLLADIIRLQRDYDEVLVLAVGGPAASCLLGCSLRKAFTKQGDFIDWTNLAKDDGNELPQPTRVFTTYHPSYVLREPSCGLSVKRHVQMLSDYLDGTLEYELDELLDISVAPHPPSYKLGRLSLDIETYGIVKGYPRQRFFHPRQSEHRDFVCKSSMVQTVGLTWRTPMECEAPSSIENWENASEGQYEPVGGNLRHAIFYMDDVTHRRRLWAWIKKCRDEPGFEYLLGQNIVFDLMYLRYCYKEARILLEDPLPIMDLMIFNYLHDESRPEKSLKALAPIFRVTKYGSTTDKKGEYKRYDSNRTPQLTQYNCQDTAATLRIAEKLMSEIIGFYGKDTKKLSPFCMKWYSQLLWLIVWMSEEGLHMDQTKLATLFSRNEKALTAIMRCGRERFDMPFRGKGSEKAKRAMMDAAVLRIEECGGEIPELELTDKKKEIRFSADNRNVLMDVMDRDWHEYRHLKLFGAYQDVAGLMDRYLYPLLVGGGKKHDRKETVILDGVTYPHWFPVPGEYEDKSTGGTKQARIVAKSPPCQTFPPPIKRCITGRFSDGWMVWFDYSQIELRVAALLSNDPAMSEEYRGSPDLHGATAKLMFGDDIVKHPDWAKYRQAGKTFNFRALYRGGGKKAQSTLMKDLGIWLPIDKIAEIDRLFWLKHRRLRVWQDELMAFVQKRGFYELPLIGQSRLFLGGARAKDRKLNEIVNLPEQAIAADIMLSAQYTLWAKFKQAGLKAIVPCNVYDAAFIECPKHEIHRVRAIMADVLPNPPFYQELCRELGRTLPLEYEVDEKRSAS